METIKGTKKFTFQIIPDTIFQEMEHIGMMMETIELLEG